MVSTFDFMDEDPKPKPAGFKPRPYQVEADIAVTQYLRDHDRCGLYMATGCGKTDVAAMLMSGEWKGCLFIAPRREIVSQTAKRLALRGVPAEIEMASEKSDGVNTVASYDTLQTKRRYEKFLRRTELLILDECHLNFTRQNMQMLSFFREHGAKIVAMSATPPEKKDMCLRDHFGEAAYVYPYERGADEGYLLRCKLGLCIMEDLDLSKFKASFGEDFNQVAVSRMLKTKANVAAVGMTVSKFWEGKPSVVYCSSISHAQLVADDLYYVHGIECAIVHSRMDEAEVRQQMHLFMEGRVQVIVNVGILTLGWDAPHVANIFVARATSSRQLYGQIFGRGTRIYPGDLITGLDTVDERLDAIARSPKPFFSVFDLTDSSRNCDLKSALDVLKPNEDVKLLKRVRRRLESGTIAAIDIDKILEEERSAAAAERLERERWAMQQRQHIGVDGRVVAYDRDPLADAEKGGGKRAYDPWWMPFGRFKGKSFKKIHQEAPWYLRSILPHIKDDRLGRNIRSFLHKN